MRYGLEDINGDNSLETRRNTDLVVGPDSPDVSYCIVSNPEQLDEHRPLAGLFNVKYALLPPGSDVPPPRGWRATVDPDDPAPTSIPVIRADYNFSAIAIPAGKHTIQLVYRPISVWLGLGVSGVSALFTIFIGFWRRRRSLDTAR